MTGGGKGGLGDEQGEAFRLGAAVGAGDLGAQHALRLDVLGEFQEGLEGGVGGLIRAVFQEGYVGAAVADQVIDAVAALDPFQHGQDGLLDQPVRRAAHGLGGGFETRT